MITPPLLKKGDLVAIVSTARKISKEELEPLISVIEEWGLSYICGKSIGAEDNQYAGSDELRLSNLQEQLNNPEIKAIWCAKGGYGTVRIIDRLDFSEFIKNPKWIIGYSDVTVLHSHIHNFGIETLHANMAIDFTTKTEATRETIRKALFEGSYSIEINNSAFNRLGIASGELVGGNLSLLTNLVGTSSNIDPKGKILFIEDLDEMLYHIDRMMQQLKRSGFLKQLAGLIVGGMNDMRDNTIPFGKSPEQIIFEAVSEYNYPVSFGFPAGHINDNRALILGRKVKFNVQEDSVTLQF